MTGEHNLETLLKTMKPELQEGEFVFGTLPVGTKIPADMGCVGIFNENEGVTFIARREETEKHGLPYQYVSRQITLTVHSSLQAVGFLAVITDALASSGISVNAISAFYHDHLFVSVERAEDAMKVLRGLAVRPPAPKFSAVPPSRPA